MKRVLKTVEAPNRDYKGFQMFDSLYKKINAWALKDDIKESVLRSDHGYLEKLSALEHLGYSQVRDYSDEILYFRNQKTGKIFGFLKSNKRHSIFSAYYVDSK